MNVARNANTTWIGQRLQTRRDIDTVAMDVVAFNYHVTKIDADAECHASVVWLMSVAFRHACLDFDGALDGIDDAAEFDQQTITEGIDDATLSVRDSRPDQFIEMGIKAPARSRFIHAH